MGPLSGLVQSIGRAEASAILAGLRWASFHGTDVCIWSDSLSSVNLVRFIQTNDHVPGHVSNYDIWKEVHDVLRSCAGLRVHFQWMPSHLEATSLESPLEDWAAHWNEVADHFAGMANRLRPQSFWQLWRRYRLSLNWWSDRIAQLRTFSSPLLLERIKQRKWFGSMTTLLKRKLSFWKTSCLWIGIHSAVNQLDPCQQISSRIWFSGLLLLKHKEAEWEPSLKSNLFLLWSWIENFHSRSQLREANWLCASWIGAISSPRCLSFCGQYSRHSEDCKSFFLTSPCARLRFRSLN